MRTFTSNLTVLSAIANTDNETITGAAIDRDISIRYSVKLNDINQAIFVPEANLVVTGSLRIAKEIATVNVWVNDVIAVVSLPEIESEIVAELTEAVEAPTEVVAEVVSELTETPAEVTEVVAEILDNPAESVISKARKSSNKRKVLAEADADPIPF